MPQPLDSPQPESAGMTPEQWNRVARVYESALEREPPLRAAFLADACAGDDALRSEVDSLLAHEGTPLVVDHAMLTVAAAVLEPDSMLEPNTHLGQYRIE